MLFFYLELVLHTVHIIFFIDTLNALFCHCSYLLLNLQSDTIIYLYNTYLNSYKTN